MLYAVSIRQPFASLILAGEKRYEARSWSLDSPGWLLLHASTNFGLTRTEVDADPNIRRAIKKANLVDRATWTRGAIVGAFEVVRCLNAPPKSMNKADIAMCGDDAECYWQIGDILSLPEPIPCKGALGLFMPDRETMAAVGRHLHIIPPKHKSTLT